MRNRKIIYSILIFLSFLVFILSIIIVNIKNDSLEIAFLDVGQGDAILISNGSHQLLIDGGRNGKILLEKIGTYIPFWDRKIELIVATHPDQDHISGLIDVMRLYEVKSVLETNAQNDSQTYQKWEESVKQENSERIEAKNGVKISFPNGVIVEVLYPFESLPNEISNDGNAKSVVLKLSYGENTFLFTGDLPTEQEKELIAKYQDLHVQVLKISHHGSKYATSNEFLSAIKPQDAIISVGKNNTYGHPNQEVVNRLFEHKISIFRTDEMRDIIYECKKSIKFCDLMK